MFNIRILLRQIGRGHCRRRVGPRRRGLRRRRWRLERYRQQVVQQHRASKNPQTGRNHHRKDRRFSWKCWPISIFWRFSTLLFDWTPNRNRPKTIPLISDPDPVPRDRNQRRNRRNLPADWPGIEPRKRRICPPVRRLRPRPDPDEGHFQPH